MNLSKLLGTTVLTSVIGLAGAAAAQDAPSEPATTVDEVVVTGSRIRLQDYTAPNPVTTVTAESIEFSGATNLGAFLTDLPSLANSLQLEEGAETDTPGLAGLNLLNLRNLGAVRTLVLIDGRRHVSSNPGTSSVDTNSIPTALVERVEVLTGGASAVYGADGVSGVVNFIMKKDFEGVDIRAQTGWSEAGSGANNFVSLLMGDNFADGRGNVTLNLEYSSDDAVTFFDRDYTRPGQRAILISNPDDPGTFNPDDDDPNQYDFVLATNTRYIDTTRGGSIYTNFNTATTLSGVTFLSDGSRFVDGQSAGGFIAVGGSGTRLDDFNDDLLPGLKRGAVNLNGRFELAPNATLFGELKYTNSQATFFAQPSYFYGLHVPLDNPYLPAVARADSLTPGGLGLSLGGVLLARDNFDLGTQNYDITRETLRGVIGLEGALTDRIDYEVSLVYGRADQTTDNHDVIIYDRVFAAADVVNAPGGPVCRSNLDPNAVPLGDLFAQFSFPAQAWGRTFTPGAGSGCLPLNLFGENLNSPEAIDWVTGDYTNTATIDQTVLSGFITGDTEGWFSLPAGAVSFVLGAEYREESSDTRPAAIQEVADSIEYTLTGIGRASRTRGSFDVKEVFGELSVPVLRDLPFAQDLRIGAAYRYSDYSTSGGTETWNVNGRWQVNDVLAFRATKARAVRAPNIDDLFAGRQQIFISFADPCSQENVDDGENPVLRRQNCAIDLTAMGVDPNSFINNSSEATGGFIRGNPDLNPEEADTLTVGFTVSPSLIRGLSLSLDYYEITIDDAIQAYDPQTIVNNCYDLPRPNAFCDLIARGNVGGNNGRITSFEQIPGNIASFQTSGVDFTVRYALDPADWGVQRDIGRFNFTLIGNKLEELKFVEASGAQPNDDLGEEDAPEWQVTFDATWMYRDVTVNYGVAWAHKTSRFTNAAMATDTDGDLAAPNLLYFDAKNVHDLQARWQVNDRFQIYGGVNNLWDQQPEPDDYTYPVSPMGRFFYVGMNARLGSIADALFWR